MRSIIFLSILSLFSPLYSSELFIEETPCAVVHTPNQDVRTFPETDVRFAGVRPRISTCGGVGWYQGNRYLFAIHMQTSSVQLYEFTEDETLKPVRYFDNELGIDLSRPENIAISKDNSLAVIPNMQSGKVQLFKLDERRFFGPLPVATIQAYKIHGARFSPDCRHLSFVSLAKESIISTYSLEKDGAGRLVCRKSDELPNPFEPLKPKSLDFSNDGRFVAIGFCRQLSKEVGEAEALVATFAFDRENGKIKERPISITRGLQSVETIIFSPDSSSVLTTDQINDKVISIGFDPRTGLLLQQVRVLLQNPESELFFPHGIAFSSDGKYLAVSNYGDDKVTVYRVKQTR